MDDDKSNSVPVHSSGSGSGKGKLRVAPKSESAKASSSTAAANTASQSHISKRRRGVGVVTPNACNECRKKRVKCDGQTPCSRCRMQRDVECVYELPVRQSKEDLRAEIEQLRRRQRSSDTVLTALGRSELWGDVVQRLHSGESVDSIYEWLEAMPARDSSSAASAPAPASGPSTAPPLLPPPPGVVGFGSVPQMPLPFPVSSGASTAHTTFSPTAMPLPSPIVPLSGVSGPWKGQHQQIIVPQPLQRLPRQGSPRTGDQQFSSTSHSTSTRSNSRQEWAPSVPSQARVDLWVQNTSPRDMSGVPEFQPNRSLLDQILAPVDPGSGSPMSIWTTVTPDANLVHHLLALYFCWEYPTFASLSKEHFLRDFQDGRQRYCSPILVNALLALGCRFSSQPNTRSNPDDPFSSGDHFFEECQRLFDLEADLHSLTTIQALGIMSIREASCGRDAESWYYAGQSIRLALEMNLHQVRDNGRDVDEIAVQSATFWGAFALDHCWSLATGSLPQCSWLPTLPPKPAIIDDIESSLWVPYTDDGSPLQRSCEQPSNVRSVYNCFCELSELVHQSLYIMHSPGRPLFSRDLLRIYTEYLNWYDSIPEVLRLGHNFTPAVLFAHMYYHFAIMLLFRPLIKLRIIGSSIQPRVVCLQAADAIQGLLRSYSQLYTLQRTPSFVPYFVLTASIMHLAIGATLPESTLHLNNSSREDERLSSLAGTSLAGRGQSAKDSSSMDWQFSPGSARTSFASSHAGGGGGTAQRLDPRVAEAINRGICDLTEMVPCHRFAVQALNILRYLTKKWNIDVPVSPAVQKPAMQFDITSDPENAVRPQTTSLNFFAANMRQSDVNCEWGASRNTGAAVVTKEDENATSSPVMGNNENPLFWTFPMQGRPIFQSSNLEGAGFAMM